MIIIINILSCGMAYVAFTIIIHSIMHVFFTKCILARASCCMVIKIIILIEWMLNDITGHPRGHALHLKANKTMNMVKC